MDNIHKFYIYLNLTWTSPDASGKKQEIHDEDTNNLLYIGRKEFTQDLKFD